MLPGFNSIIARCTSKQGGSLAIYYEHNHNFKLLRKVLEADIETQILEINNGLEDLLVYNIYCTPQANKKGNVQVSQNI